MNKFALVFGSLLLMIALAGCSEKEKETETDEIIKKDAETGEILNDLDGPCYSTRNLQMEGFKIDDRASKRFLASYGLPQAYQVLVADFNGNIEAKITILDQNGCVIWATHISREQYMERIGLENPISITNNTSLEGIRNERQSFDPNLGSRTYGHDETLKMTVPSTQPIIPKKKSRLLF